MEVFTILMIILLFLLILRVFSRPKTVKKGDIFIKKGKDGNYYKMRKVKNSGFGKYQMLGRVSKKDLKKYRSKKRH